jgi:hypothetical protein
MLELYLTVGIIFAIVATLLVFRKDFDEYGVKHFGHPMPLIYKLSWIFLNIPFWPVMLWLTFFGKVDNE